MRRSRSALLPSSTVLTTNLSMPFTRTFVLASLIACLLVVASPLLAQTPALVTQPVDNSVRTVLPGNVHPLARSEFDQGEAPSDLVLHRMLLVLKRSDQQETALRRLIENQQFKKSPSYHQWLTPEQFGVQFGPADSDIAAVTNWLQASGFEIAQVSNGRTIIEFSGTAGQVKQAFGTAIHKYVVEGEEHWANVGNPSIPTALTPVVAGLDSLHNFLKKAQNSYVGTYSETTKQLTSPQPVYTYSCGTNCTDYAVTPFDFATIYNLLPLWGATPTAFNGTGQTIAIVGRTDINPNDAVTFWGLFGLGTATVNGVTVPMPTLNVITNGPDPGFTPDESEADIDTQWSGAAAPGATIDFVTSESTETDDGTDLSAFFIVDNNVAPIMSESYGTCEANLGSGGTAFYGTIWEQAAAQGMTVMVSSGDNGSAGCDSAAYFNAAQNGLGVNGLASTPFNVAVGGTDFNQYNNWATYWNSTNAPVTQESAKGYIPETTWNSSCTNALFVTLGYGANAEAACNSKNIGQWLDTVGGSGGESIAWLKPTWQTGTPADNARDLPDVSLFASPGFLSSFYVICQSDLPSVGGTCTLNNLPGFGGTSVASPAFAGIMGLVDQKWGQQGNANLVLYNLAAKQPSAFHDVPAGSTNSVPCFKGTANCTTNVGTDTYGVLSGFNTASGYDLATGLGSVNANNLVTNWNSVTFNPTTTTLALNTATITHGTATAVSVTAAPTSGSGTPTGDVALLVSPKPGTPGIDWNTLANGGINWQTTLLPGGTYEVIAHYEGDTTFGGSYSSPSASITVKPETSFVDMPGVVDVTDPQNPVYGVTTVPYGSPYLLRADVQNSQQNFCNLPAFQNGPPFIACPTGTMTFKDNGNLLDGGTFKLNSFGYTEDQLIQLTGGAHTLVGSYGGDPSYKASTSGNVSVTITQAATAINDLAAPGTANTNQQFTVTADVATASSGVAPTGTVKFFFNGTLLPGTVQYTPVNGSASGPASLGASLSTSISTAGTYTITATYSGDSNYAAVTTSNSVQIVVSSTANFTLSANPTSLSIAQGSNGTSTITVNPTNGFTGSVTLAASGLPSGVTAGFGTNPTTGTSVLTLTASGSATLGTATVTITGTSGALAPETTTVSLTVTAGPNFTLSANPTSLSVAQGSKGTSTITVNPTGGFTGSVMLAASGLPNGVTAGFGTNPTTGTSVLTLTASGSATLGTATVTITGTSGALAPETTTVSLTVTAPPNFTLSANPTSLSIGQGSNGTSTITVNPTNGFTGSVMLAASGLPNGVTAGFGTNPTTGTSVLTLTASGSATLGTATVTITGTSAGLTPETTTISLTVTPPANFTLSASPTSLSVAQGSMGTSTVTVTPMNGFAGSVSLAASGLPNGVTALFNPASATTTSTLTLTASETATAGGPVTVTITGTSGGLMATTTVALTVVGLSVPGTLTAPAAANPGQTTTTTMALAPVGAGTFGSSVTYTCSSGLPAGATCSFSPTQINAGGSAQTVTITVNTAGPFTGGAGGAQRASEPKLRSQNQRLWLPLGLPLAGIVVVGLFGQRLPRRYKIVGLCLALALTGFLVACGGGTSTPPPVTVTVSPGTVTTLYPNLNVNGNQAPEQQQQFTATVNNSTDQTVTWAVMGSGNGSISGSGLYMAPATLPSPANVTVTATSAASAVLVVGSATVNLQTPTPPVTKQMVTVTVTEGTIQNTTSFSLTVN